MRRPDRDNIDAALAEPVELLVNTKNGYSGAIPAVGSLVVNDMDVDTLEAFKVFCDAMTYEWEAGLPIVKVGYNAGTKTFDFSGSYLRDKVETQDVTALATNFPVKVIFELPGFEVNPTVEITYPYNGIISTEDKELAEVKGIVITMSGIGFNINNETDVKVSFGKPDAEPGVYVIDYPAANTIIPATVIIP